MKVLHVREALPGGQTDADSLLKFGDQPRIVVVCDIEQTLHPLRELVEGLLALLAVKCARNFSRRYVFPPRVSYELAEGKAERIGVAEQAHLLRHPRSHVA
jgi:hypothetical protein